MNVELISITESKVQGQSLTPEELIVYTARVSNPSNQMNMETADKLISYLVKNKHWSPFEMVSMGVKIVTSRAIAPQILRHRSFSFQEFSQRYAEVSDFEPVQTRKSGTTNRQSSSEEFDPYVEILGIETTASRAIHNIKIITEAAYRALLDAGVAKECARSILPGFAQTRIYMTGTIRSWIHYLQIRTGEHTQLEHRQIADEIAKIFKQNFPNIAKGLEI